jgi:hypothetical protein
VLAIEVGGNRDAIVDSETGHLIRERSPEAFAKIGQLEEFCEDLISLKR